MAARPKIYCINLDRSPDRWRFMQEQFDGLGLEYERIAAVDGRTLTADRLPEVAVMERVAEVKDLTPNMIGAVLSHVKAYRRFLEDGAETAVFMEDDVELLHGFAEALPAVAAALPAQAAALLYFHGQKKRYSSRGAIALSDGRGLYRAMTPWGDYSAGGYMLSRATAAAIADFNFPVYTTPDSWGVFCRGGALGSLWSVLPPVSSPADFSSDIGYSWKGQLARRVERTLGRGLPGPLRRLFGNRLQLHYELVDETPVAV